MTEQLAQQQDLRRLRWRLLWLALLWLALVTLGGWWAARWRLDTYRHEVYTSGVSRLGSLQNNVENHFRSTAALGQALARWPQFAEYLKKDLIKDPKHVTTADLSHLRAELAARADVQAMGTQLALIVRDFQIRQAYLQDVYGNGVADSEPFNPKKSVLGANFALRSYFTQALENGAGFQYVEGQFSRIPGFNFSARIEEKARALGILVLKTDPTSMLRLLNDSLNRKLYLVDADGVIVASNQSEHLIKQVPGGPSLAGRSREVEGAYRSIPTRLNWSSGFVDFKEQHVPAYLIDGVKHLVLTRPTTDYPYNVWVLSPLSDEPLIVSTTALSATTVLAIGWLLLWAYQRRREKQAIIEQVRRETLDMTRALPLTLFRYRVQPNGFGRFTYLGAGVQDVFEMDEAELRQREDWVWRLAGQSDGLPPTQPVEFPLHTKGQRRWISANSAMADTPDGGRIYDGYWLDVSSRRQAETRFEAAFQHAPTAFFFFHARLGIQRCNPATLSLFGARSFDEIKGQIPWGSLLSPPRQANGRLSEEGAAEILSQRASQNPEQAFRFEWRHLRLDGSAFEAEISLIRLDAEESDMYFAIVEDVSARKLTEEALRTASDAAQATTRAKSAFLANMSHEIRTPMNAIIGMTHLALGDVPPDKLRGYVAKAHQAATNLLGIINDVLDMSKIEAGHLELECIEFPLQEVLDQVADVLSLPAERKGLELLFAAPPDLPRHLMGDPTRLRQILVNLGANAIKFTESGSITTGLEVQHHRGDEIVLHGWVRDTGIGMSADQQARLFKPFSQVDASTTRRYGGTGLGLTISAQLVEAMGGRLWVDSELHKGSTFHFTLRMGVPERVKPMARVREGWQGKRVLLVDDNADARLVMGEMAAKMGLKVDYASHGEQALKMITQAPVPYDWILLDWKMPGMDGITCARHVRDINQQRFPDANPCILLVTAFNRADALKAAEHVQLADVLTKPVTPSTLFDSLSRALAREAGLQVMDVVQARVPTLPASKAVTQARLDGIRVLLVEDQPLNQELAKELLERVGAEVAIAEDGLKALEQLNAGGQAFDCVLMDCQMPVMDGYTATERIRAETRWQHLPIIAMTASALVSDRERALAAGMNDHIPKPLDVQQMFQVISRWIDVAQRARVKS